MRSNGHAFYNHSGSQCSGVNLGVVVLQTNPMQLERMLAAIANEDDPSHQATNGSEQDFLTCWPGYANAWEGLELKYNYQLDQLKFVLDQQMDDADSLRLLPEHVKVYHFSSDVKPSEFYCRGTVRSGGP